MAETTPSDTEQELLGIKPLLWGNEIKSDIFKRWSQGFYYAQSEPSALEQSEGGPCAIIAPVQAFITKNLLLEFNDFSFRSKITQEIQKQCLINALSEILQQCNGSQKKYYLVYLTNYYKTKDNKGDINNEALIQFSNNPNTFHENLKIHICVNLDEVKEYLHQNAEQLKGQFGILLFLYSVIATRGIKNVQSEIDTQEPLIDDTYGYGSQSLINLMITGRATTYVWDHEQDVGGLKLRGLEKQSQIGFITIMEHLRYCTVGSFYKNPVHPVWILASDTHLSVLFSDERKLVSPETKSEQARRVFKSFDPDGNNFISAPLLQDVLSALDLVSDEAYVDIMRKKLDGENLGIILLNAFMDEFFPKEESSVPDMFTLVHYNGLAQSNVTGQVRFHIGYAVLLESDLKSICESNPMLTVLQTKWPNIEVNWDENVTPSLN